MAGIIRAPFLRGPDLLFSMTYDGVLRFEFYYRFLLTIEYLYRRMIVEGEASASRAVAWCRSLDVAAAVDEGLKSVMATPKS
jgi:hypothetical protein